MNIKLCVVFLSPTSHSGENLNFSTLSFTKQVSLIVTLPLDREQQEEHHFVLEASDGGSPPLVGSMTITVRVLDVNDNRPMFHPRMLSVTLDEATAVGSVIAR